MYVYCDIEGRLRNRCCSGKAISNTQSENVFVALGIQHAMCMRHFVICGLLGFTIFFPRSYIRHDFRKKDDIEHKSCVSIFSTTFFFLDISHH
jgi:hypothetical protein